MALEKGTYVKVITTGSGAKSFPLVNDGFAYNQGGRTIGFVKALTPSGYIAQYGFVDINGSMLQEIEITTFITPENRRFVDVMIAEGRVTVELESITGSAQKATFVGILKEIPGMGATDQTKTFTVTRVDN